MALLFHFLFLVVFLSLFFILVNLFGWPWERAKHSLDFFANIFGWITSPQSPEKRPDLPCRGIEQPLSQDTLKELWYWFNVSSAALANAEMAKAWLSWLASFLLSILQSVLWLPLAICILILMRLLLTSPSEGQPIGKSRPLIWWDSIFVPRVVYPLKDLFEEFSSWFRLHRWSRRVLLFLFIFVSPIGWAAVDCLIAYFALLASFDLFFLPSLLSSLFEDIRHLFSPSWPFTAAALGFFVMKWIKESALSVLGMMQESNEVFADSLSVINAINGHVGSGKTTMLSSIAVDQEVNFRDYYLSVMMKYQAAFPAFAWPKLERWIRKRVSVVDTLRGWERLATGSRIKEALISLWDIWIKEGCPSSNAAGREIFFGYDFKRGINWFDGAKDVPLIEAVQAYAESYFMYFSGQKLVTSNYPIAIETGQYGEYFPVFQPSSAYLSDGRTGQGNERAFSHIFDEDFFRIKTPMKQDNQSASSSIGGGVIAMTEASNERGNRFDYIGISRKDAMANRVNDGWNQAMRLIRHWFMVDGRPCCCFIYDYQRESALNADARHSAESVMFIQRRGEERNALPFWWLDDFICSVVETWWKRFYWYSWRPNRCKETLLVRIIGAVCRLFSNHRQRMRYRYGYEIVNLSRTVGGTSSQAGERSDEKYFFIYRRTRSNFFRSDVYAPILAQRSLPSKTGWMDQPTFSSTTIKAGELSLEHSFFMNDLSSLFDPESSLRAMREISTDMAKWGSDDSESPNREKDIGGC